MAVLNMEYKKGEFDWIKKIQKMLPELNTQALGFVGNESKKILMYQMLSGQIFDYKGEWFDKKGRRKASYTVKWNTRVTVSSYPTNFFTKGRVFKKINRATEAPVRVFEPLRSKVESHMQRIMNEFDKKYLEKEVAKITEKKG